MEQKRCPTCSKLLNPATDFFHGKLEREIIELIRMADGGTGQSIPPPSFTSARVMKRSEND